MNQSTFFRNGLLRGFAGLIFILLTASTTFGQLRIVSHNGLPVVADEVIVRLRTDANDALNRVRNVNPTARVDEVSRRLTLHVVRAPGQSVQDLVRIYSNQPDVLYAEPNYIVSAVKTPNDALYSSLWGMPKIGAPAAWNLTTGKTAVVVGVIDSGVDYNHPDLAGNMWSAPTTFTVTVGGIPIICAAGTHGFNTITNTCNPMDDNNHGTHVSGSIGATGNNNIGVVGVNWTTRIMGLKLLDAAGNGTTTNAIHAIEFARQVKSLFAGTATPVDIRVLSNSWGGGGSSQSLQAAINSADADEMLFVAAAGNNSSNNDIFPFYPASYNSPNIISVAATTSSDGLAGFSNYGATKVHLGAPGETINSTVRGAGYGYSSGTSMAAPYVSGLAVLTLAACPGLDTDALKNIILANVDSVPSLQGKTITGGRINADKTLRSCVPTMPLVSSANPAAVGTPVTFTATVAGNNPTGTVTFDDGGNTISGCAAVALTGSGNSKSAACTTSNLAPGSHSIVAYYTGDANNSPAASLPLTQTISSNVPAALAGHWALDETSGTTAADSSGNNNAGTLINGPAWNGAGKIGGALSFDGVNDYVSLGNPQALIPGNAITVATWMRLNNTSSSQFIIAKHDNVTPHNQTWLRYTAPGFITCMVGGTSIDGGSGFVVGAWYHLACTYDGTTMRLYVNGVQVMTGAKSGPIADEVGTSWLLGAGRPANPALFMNGLLDDVRIYNYGLSSTEVSQLYNLGADTTPPVLSNGSPTGTLPAGTTQTTISLTSDENATCRYSTVAGTPYASMPNVFSTTGGTAHSTQVTGLSNGNTYTFYVRCLDAASNPNTTDYTISFSVAASSDTAPPVLSNGSPTGTLPAGTTQTTISLTSDENATCRYSTVAGTPYASMPNLFSTTGGTAHSTLVTGLSNGNTYTFYVRCVDGVFNANATDFAISFSVASTGPDITTGLQGHWALDETSGTVASDSSGNNNTGTLINGPAWNGAGKIGGALSFDGVNDYVSLGNPSTLIPGSTITVATWMRLNNTSNSQFIVTKHDNVTPHNQTWLRYTAPGFITCMIGGTSIDGGSGFVVGSWYHLACTYDGTTMRLYVNGAQVMTGAKTGPIADEVGTSWLLGAGRPANPALFMNGLLDDVRIYNRELSAGDISHLYTLSPDTTPPVLSNGSPTGTLQAGTTQTTISLTSDENATCRYSTVAGTPYASMPNLFSTTGGTAHSTQVTGLSNGNTYAFYVRCVDGASNANATDFAISFSVASAGPDITTGLQGHWALDETSGTVASDSSGNNNAGTLINGPVWNGAGKIGGALSFDGVNDYVSLGNPQALIPGNAITVATWMRLNNTSSSQFIITKHDNVTPHNQTWLRYTAPGFITCMVGGTSIDGGSGFVVGAWYHLACTYDGTTMRLYVNGVQVMTGAKSGPIADEVGTSWLLGAGRPANPALFMNGLLDDVRIYNRALAAADIAHLSSF